MARLSELSGGVVEEIALVGGEPLLHADMIEIVKISRSYFPVGVLSIWTNGILLKQQPEAFWTALEENNVVINLSSYPIKLDVSAIEATAKAHNVTFIYSERDIEWRYIPIDLDGGQNRVDSFARCYAENRCFQLKEGRIYHCWRSAYVNYFNKAFGVDLQVTEEDYIDIYKADTINEILRFLRQVPSFCRYCIQRKEVHEEWGITKKSIDEWVMP
jgi:MoaA/NifB/PqqE/SkfB family radical SAM enzyme